MKNNLFLLTLLITILLVSAGCIPATPEAIPTRLVLPSATPTPLPSPTASVFPSPTLTRTPAFTPTLTATPTPLSSPTPPPVPAFDHIAIIVFENKEFSTVIGNPQMKNFNRLAREYTLLTQFFAITHPSLPNYIALISGDTQGVDSNKPGYLIDAPMLADLVEASRRTWKSYQEALPSPCYLQDTARYVEKHNPFVFFSSVRNDQERCQESIVPLSQLETDIANGTLPNFIFITPDLCNSAHDSYVRPESCGLNVADAWLQGYVDKLLAYPPLASNGLIVLTWDEGQGDHGCCGMDKAGGRIATILISPHAKQGFQDDRPYTLYSLLRTISMAWNLPLLGKASDPLNEAIMDPWKR